MNVIRKILDGITARLGGDRSLSTISRSSDIVLAVLIIGILTMIIIPVNPHIIDYLIALNLTISVALLMVALYIPSAVHLSIFPSLLLITTLYRLGIKYRFHTSDSFACQCRRNHLSIRKFCCRR